MDEEQYLDWLASLPQETARLTNSRLKILDYTSKTKKSIVLSLPTSIIGERRNVLKKTPKRISAKKKNGTEIIAKGTYLILRHHRHLLSKWN